VALCDVDSKSLEAAHLIYPDAKIFKDYRVMLKDMSSDFDAVIVSTPDHTHAPASIMAMEMNKPVYCQKPLTHFVSEAREMKKLAEQKNLVTQMGIQVHSFYDYKLATVLIQSGIIGKVHTVRAWTDRNFGYDGPVPDGKIQFLIHLIGIYGLEHLPKDHIKKYFIIPVSGESLSIMVVVLWEIWVFIFLTPHTMHWR
jgi:predicted dehydrogenase